MADNTDLWTATVAAYDSQGLIELTNLNDRSQTSVNGTVGTTAAQAVIDLWPAYAQVAYDGSNALHVEVGIMGVISMLWRRGGSSSTIEQVKWDEVFGDGGLLEKLRRTGPRGRAQPSISGSTKQSSEATSDGESIRPWSDRDSLPVGFRPIDRVADGS